MQDRLTHAEIAQIEQSLQNHLKKNGHDILGAQLGQFVRRAIAPKTIKSVGGLQSLVTLELSQNVEFMQALPSDSLYRVKTSGAGVLPATAERVEVTTPQFWDAFSNPNIECVVGIIPATASFHVSLPDDSLPSDVVLLRKMTSDEFRAEAKVYAESQEDAELSSELLATLEKPVFYHGWISVLRSRRSSTENHLRSWEIARTRLVIGRLTEELERVGIDSYRAAKMASEVRPKPSKAPKKLVSDQAHPHVPAIATAAGETTELQELRELVHRAIDRMQLADLNEIRIPAGLLLEIYQKPAD
ncbi:hypothetical protein C1Y35_07665 [Pseudomonas sp. GW456-L14]|uniref:hypothetical protein n=1 Tax=unclassified Pseudomonas TaxID=196821 RepID=UPI000C888BB1|nr:MULTISPECIES: hypothetical protein [unclassified Pseudomonas]PMY41455.1 hypothetical protein C1Y35_07665 [Pseudomonas sp. GW456-L14]PMY54764.1 hypothetical protein C1Y34_17075 [Pseudomonas sp. GW456-L12]